MKGRNLVNGSAACNSFFHYNGTHRDACGDHACTREREFLEIVADRHDDHVSKVIEEDARRFAKTSANVGNSRDFETDHERHCTCS